MKKVLFVATITKHITTFHLPYLKLFKDNGYEVHVATDDDVEIPYCDVHHKISIKRSPFKISNIKAIKELKKICNEEKFDIIHCHTPMGSVVARLAAKKARKNGTRVIYTAHGYHFFKGAPLKNWMFFYPVEKYLAKYTDTQITITQEDYELAKKKFKIKDLHLVHGVGLDEKKFNVEISDEEKRSLKKKLGLEENDFVVVYTAEISKRKRQELLIKAFQRIIKNNKNVKLLLVGSDSLNGKCQKLAKKLKIDGNVLFLGYRKDIPEILNISDIAISVARQEGLPVNIMEAMYMELPIVATDCRGNRELVIHNENGFIVPQNDVMENNIYNYTSLLIKDINLREKFGKKSKDEIKKYTLDNVIKDMKKIYFRSEQK